MESPLESLPIAVLRARAGGDFSEGNRAWRTFAGHTSLGDAIHPDDRSGVELSLRTGLMIGAEFALEARVRNASGGYVRHLLRFAPGERAEEWLAVATDIDAFPTSTTPTERAGGSALPDATDLVDFRNQMAGIIGHDLRNPLSTLVMGSALLRSRLKSEAELKLVDRLVKASERMTRMISQLVDYSALRLGGAIEISREAGDFVSIVHRTVVELAKARNVDIAIDAPETVTGEWDHARLEQVIANLVVNAILHGAPAFEVTVRATDIDVALEVRDHGAPIPSEVLSQVFSPARKRLSPTREAGSLGLGLYVTEQIVQAHGGRMSVRSNEDGTVFRVELPRTARPHEPLLSRSE